MLIQDAFNKCVVVGDCLEWQGSLNYDGYPRATINDNPNGIVHRELFFYLNGYYPPVVRHRCDNKICLKPEHLLPGTHIDNMKDRNERGRIFNQVFPIEIRWVSGLRGKGLTYSQIAGELEITYKRVEYIMNKYVKGK